MLNSLFSISILIAYLGSLVSVGHVILRRFPLSLPPLLRAAGSYLVGVGVAVPVTYLLSILFVQTGEPILWGVISMIVAGYWMLGISKRNTHVPNIGISLREMLLLALFVGFSLWIMGKTLRPGINGELFVGANTVFDFGHALGIVRSFSWGNNIPMMSPFHVGAPFFYHFFFYFFVAIWEYFGTSLVWAVNIPSILSFTALLIVTYFLPMLFVQKNPFIGIVAVLLTVTNSSLAFWRLAFKSGLSVSAFKELWALPSYPFAGPFDGSVISLFVTLNTYVNQRHLAFSVGLGLFLYYVAASLVSTRRFTNRQVLVVGLLSGTLMLWNMAVWLVTMACIGLLFIVHKEWKKIAYFAVGNAMCALVINAPNAANLVTAFRYVNSRFGIQVTPNVAMKPSWTLLQYLWENLGILVFVAPAAFAALPRKSKRIGVPFIAFFFFLCLLAGVHKRGFDQKYYSFLIIGVNAVGATLVGNLLLHKSYGMRGLALLLGFVLTVSGIVDLIPIKNEFAYPFIDRNLLPVISWIRTNTEKDAVFVSYADIIDPVVLAGRKNYFGFFGNIGWVDRTANVERIYRGDADVTRREGVTYIVIPKFEKSDFPYSADAQQLLIPYKPVYSDPRYTIVRVQ